MILFISSKVVSIFSLIGISLITIFISVGSCDLHETKETPTTVESPYVRQNDEEHYASLCKTLGIENIRENLEGIKIRIWGEFSIGDTGKLLELRKDKDIWNGKYYSYKFSADGNLQNTFITYFVLTAKSISTWERYIQKIEKIGLYNLADNNRNPNYGLCNDGGALVLEIVRDSNFVESVYPCWDVMKDQTDINKIKAILRETEKEFNLKILPLERTTN